MQPWLIALLRGAAGGVIVAGAAFFAQLSTGGDLKRAGIAAGAAFFGVLVIRAGVEGLIDQSASKP
jgi:hypothetical protein